jgi:hypothetical protein
MKRPVILFTILLLLAGPAQAAGAEKVRLKYVGAAYGDTGGAGLRNPEGVACDGTSFWVADTGNSRLLRYRLKDQTLAPEAELRAPFPTVVQVSSKGEILALNAKERRIVRLTPSGEAKGFVTAQGAPGSADMVPKSFRLGKNDTIYILDVLGARVLVLAPDGKYLRQIGFPEHYGFFSDLAVDGQGTVFLVDSVQATIHTAAADADRFTALTADLKEFVNFPTSLEVDSRRGVIYLVDQYGSGLAMVGRDGSFLGRNLGLGWKETLLHYPAQVCLGGEGHLFIADRNNNRAQLFTVVDR